MTAPVVEFGDFRLDCDRFQLCRGGRVLKLERKPTELLILLAMREGEVVSRAEIAECLWGGQVFVDTEHGINTAVRKVRQVLRDDSEKPRFVHTVTGRGYRFVGPVTLIRADAPSSDRDSSVVPPEAPAEDQVPRTSGRRFPLVFGFIAALALFSIPLMLYIREHTARAAEPAIKSLAILPLENVSGDPKQDYFADGMTDELTTMLARDSTLRVISRTSAMQFKDPHQPLREIARSLGVDGIIEGSISRDDGKVHVTVQLIHAPSDTNIWANSYDCDMKEVAALPTEVAQAIAKRLGASAPVSKPARYINPEAHDAYLHGRYLWFAGKFKESAMYYQKATELQPDYALGWAGLSDYYGAGTMSGVLDPRTALPLQAATAKKAIALDDTIPQTHLSLAAVYWTNSEFPRALEEIDRAIQIDPEYAEAYRMRAYVLSEVNRHSEAIASAKKGMELDPFSRPWFLAFIYFTARQYDAAITDASQRLESTPNQAILYKFLADSYHAKGENQKSAEMLEKQFSSIGRPEIAKELHHSFELGGYDAVVRLQINLMEHRSGYIPVVDLAGLYGQLHQREKTLALLDEGYRQHAPHLLDIQITPDFDFLHKDERYRSLVRKAGIPPAW